MNINVATWGRLMKRAIPQNCTSPTTFSPNSAFNPMSPPPRDRPSLNKRLSFEETKDEAKSRDGTTQEQDLQRQKVSENEVQVCKLHACVYVCMLAVGWPASPLINHFLFLLLCLQFKGKFSPQFYFDTLLISVNRYPLSLYFCALVQPWLLCL